MFGTFMSVTTNTEDDVRFPLVMSYIDIKYMIKPLARSLAGIDALVNYIWWQGSLCYQDCLAPREHHISHDDEGYKVEWIDSYYYAYKLTASILKEVDLLNMEMCGPLVRAIVETVNNV